MRRPLRSRTGFFDLKLRTETRQYVPNLLAIRRIVADPQPSSAYRSHSESAYFECRPGRQVHIANAAERGSSVRTTCLRSTRLQPTNDTPRPPSPAVADRAAAILRQLAASRMRRLWIAAVRSPPPQTLLKGATLRRSRVTTACRSGAEGRERNDRVDHHHGPAAAHPDVKRPPRPHRRARVAARDRRRQPRTRAGGDAGPQVHTVAPATPLGKPAPTVDRAGARRANGIGTRLVSRSRTAPVRSGRILSRVPRPRKRAGDLRVKRGDTLSQIAERFQVTIRQLMGWNDLRSPSSLRAGQRLILYVDPSRFSGG